jgi:hypothetical protein
MVSVMSVKDLVELLKNCDPEALVMIKFFAHAEDTEMGESDICDVDEKPGGVVYIYGE